jgi:hypothetical protein
LRATLSESTVPEEYNFLIIVFLKETAKEWSANCSSHDGYMATKKLSSALIRDFIPSI